MSPAKPDQQLAAEESVRRAQADLAQAQNDLDTATSQASEAHAQAEAADLRRDSADPSKEKTLAEAVQQAQVAAARAEILAKRLPEAEARLVTARTALAVAELARDEVLLVESRRALTESEAGLEAMVREFRGRLVARLLTHRSIVSGAAKLAVSVHASNPEFHDVVSEVWTLPHVDLERDRLPERDVLAGAERVVDSKDLAAWEKAHPPPPDPHDKLLRQAEERHVQQMVADLVERREYEARRRQRLQRGETVPLQQSPETAVHRAIDAKVERDNDGVYNPHNR